MNLVYHQSNFDLRGQILRHLNTANLSQIVNQYFTYKPIEKAKYYITDSETDMIGKIHLIRKVLFNITEINI